MNALMHTPANPGLRRVWADQLVWMVVALALISYSAPWLINEGASLTPNAYDLAEWASLNPATHVNSPPFLPSFLLRLPPVCLALILAFRYKANQAFGWTSAAFVLLTAFALLPPLEFFTQATGDTNYRQQFVLSAMTLIGGLVGLSSIVKRSRPLITLVLAFIGVAVCILGLVHGYSLMRQFNLADQLGAGGVALTMIFIVIGIAQFRRIRRLP